MPTSTQHFDFHFNAASRGWTCEPPRESAITFHRQLGGYAPTPLQEVPTLAEHLGLGRLFVKDESQRFDLGAFKFLGASWAVHQAVTAAPSTQVLTCATDGNHGRALARMARALGLAAVIFVPRAVPDVVIDRVRAEGAEVHLLDDDYDGVVHAARGYAMDHPDTLVIQDTSWDGYEQVPAWIVEGYSTLFVETDHQLRARGVAMPSLVVVPVGVGSVAQAGIAHYRNTTLEAPPRVLSAEPETAACVLRSLRHGEPLSVETSHTIMNGLNCGTPSPLAWPYLRDGVDAAAAITDSSCERAMVELAEHGIESGPSGASTYAALRDVLSGPEGDDRRDQLGLGRDAVVICFSTEGPISS